MQEGTDDLPDSLIVSLDDANTYMNVTEDQLRILLHTNYNEFKEKIFDVLDSELIFFKESLAIQLYLLFFSNNFHHKQ